MTLRTRILLAFGYLVLLVLVTAALSVTGYYTLSEKVNALLSERQAVMVDIAAALSETEGLDEEYKKDMVELLERSRKALQDSSEQITDQVDRSGVQIGLIATLALLSMTFLSYALKRNVLVRLEKLQRFANSIGQGKSHLRLTLQGRDEFSALANQLNRGLDLQEDLQARLEGRLNQEKVLVTALLRAFDKPAALLDFDGSMLASTLALTDELALLQHGEKIKSASKERLNEMNGSKELVLNLSASTTAHLRLIGTSEDNAIGWLLWIAPSR